MKGVAGWVGCVPWRDSHTELVLTPASEGPKEINQALAPAEETTLKDAMDVLTI